MRAFGVCRTPRGAHRTTNLHRERAHDGDVVAVRRDVEQKQAEGLRRRRGPRVAAVGCLEDLLRGRYAWGRAI